MTMRYSDTKNGLYGSSARISSLALLDLGVIVQRQSNGKLVCVFSVVLTAHDAKEALTTS